ncbi:histidine phosphatase family protein [Paenibacillus sp. GSMTC-2017]|uniref:histidine phosphatase family protein n=1 Tax=Paenibacillus sp. GSMTC-2017 TaxID=2794350 RepID=UPI0018D67F3C|nr:histidine phosphatase family protein [Paenibacillus sp. GSMTC-2017]MBH5317644.1 histidine phosphatase family protein [Paenibacillus sp. GSMTC-2017]
MSTFVYFVRHAQSIFVEGQERKRGLSGKGKLDALTVKEILKVEAIDHFVSSPYERAIETIRPAANEFLNDIRIEEDLRERAIGDFSPLLFNDAKYNIYSDKLLAFPNGESSVTAQERGVHVIERLLNDYKNQKIVIGTHGDIMTLILNYYDIRFDFNFWQTTSMPDIYKLHFEKNKLIDVIRLWDIEST